jgi:hypothetical protein
MSNDDRIEYHVCEFFVPVIINDDRAHLTDEEEVQLNEFLDDHGQHFALVYNEEFPDDPEQFLSKCDVTGKIAWCYVLITN